MRIGMVLDSRGGYPPDIRVEKETQALCQAGFDVALLCAAAKAGQPREERLACGLKIYRKRPSASLGARAVRAARRILTGWAVEPAWLKPVSEFIDEYRPHVLHCHDLRIVPTVLAVAVPLGIPVVADLHENWPAAVVVYTRTYPWWKQAWFRLTQSYRTWRRIERRSLRHCERVIVVVPEAARRLTDDYGLPADRIIVVSNTEDDTTFEPTMGDPTVAARCEGLWVASYIGGVGPHRGVTTAIRAAALVADRVPTFRLLIVGLRAGQKAELERLVAREGAAGCVELVEWVPPAHVAGYIAASAVCLVPHDDFEHTQTTVPHKLFQYMLLGKPVVVSDCAPLKRIVDDAGAGLVFRANDAADLARRLVELHASGDDARAYGERGRQAALGPYAWRHDAARLVAMYRGLDAGA